MREVPVRQLENINPALKYERYVSVSDATAILYLVPELRHSEQNHFRTNIDKSTLTACLAQKVTFWISYPTDASLISGLA